MIKHSQDRLVAMSPSQMKYQQVLSSTSNGAGGKANYCMTYDQTSSVNTPTKLMTALSQLAPSCRFTYKQAGTNANALTVTGRCADAIGFTGRLNGTVNVKNSQSWTANLTGVGRLPDAMMKANGMTPRTDVPMVTSITSAWKGWHC